MRAPPALLTIASLLILALFAPACGGGPEPTPGPVDLTERLAAGEVRAGIIEDPAALIGGPKAEAMLGDVKLYNSKVAFIVESLRRAGGYRYWGGNLADADLIRPEGEPGHDLYGETFFAWNFAIFQPTALEILSDGRDGTDAHLRLTGKSTPFAFADALVRQFLDPDPVDLAIVYDYRLGPDDEALHLTITLANVAGTATEITMPLLFGAHGDGVEAYAPGPGFSNSGASTLPYIGAVGRDLSYGVLADDDDLSPLFAYKAVSLTLQDAYTLPAGRETSLEYDFAITDGSAAGLDRIRGDLRGYDPGARINGTVTLPATVAPDSAWIAVRKGSDVVTLSPVDAAGAFSVPVAPGLYEVFAFAPGHLPADPVPADLTSATETTVALALPLSAEVTSSVTDSSGANIPARVTFMRINGTPGPDAPEEVRTGFSFGRGTGGVAYVVGKSETIVLPAGDYRAVASRGPSYELDTQDISVTAGEELSIAFTLERVIDTRGWVSADFHIHALRSSDSKVPYDIRAKQAATEDLDVPVLTEHVYVSGLQPAANALGLGEEVVGIVGQEVTTFTYGHFNAFPLIWDPTAINQGAIYEHGRTPKELFADIRAQNPADEIIQVNHPRATAAGGYFDWIGLDAVADTTARPESWSMAWDTIEAFNGGCSRDKGNGASVDDWIGLTNHGYKKTLSSGSDTHNENSPPGIPRNWIHIDKPTLAADHQAIVDVVRARKLFVSCGPFVRFAAEDGTDLGGLTSVDTAGEVRFTAKVEAPSWIHLDEIRLLENGVPIQSVNIASETAVVRYDGVFTAAPATDAWYSLEVLGSGPTAPALWRGPPYALTNSIEVDTDGDGMWSAPDA